MGIKLRLTILSFFQFFVWGAWLITIGTYCFNAKGWTGAEFGAIFFNPCLIFFIHANHYWHHRRQMDECGKTLWDPANHVRTDLVLCTQRKRSGDIILCNFRCDDLLHADNFPVEFNCIYYFKRQ